MQGVRINEQEIVLYEKLMASRKGRIQFSLIRLKISLDKSTLLILLDLLSYSLIFFEIIFWCFLKTL